MHCFSQTTHKKRLIGFAEKLKGESDDAYLKRMQEQTQWGGHLEIVAMAELLQRNFLIYHDDRPDAPDLVGPMQPSAAADDTEPFRLFYSGRNHYQPLLKGK